MSPLKVSEVFCYICRGILIEPVTLPCSHVFCFSCFEQSMQETSYSCPLCRKRISNWVRSVKKSNSLVNVKLWTQIQDQYKEEVRLKLKGEDDGLDQRVQRECPVFPSTSKPGEVAQEFSKLLNDFRSERERLKQAEELASKEYIMKLKEEEERQRQLLEKDNILRIKQDSDLAMKIQEEINKEISSPSHSDTNKKSEKRAKRSNRKSNEYPVKGPMDGFLKMVQDTEHPEEQNAIVFTEQAREERSTSTDSTDSIRLEMNLFKPIKKVRRTPPKLYPDGRINEISLTKVTPLKLNFSNLGPSSSSTTIIEGKNIHSIHSAFVDTNSGSLETRDNYESPSKRLRFTPDGSVLKDITLGENADSNSSTVAQEETMKKKSSIVRKSAQESYSVPYKIPKYDLDSRFSKDSKGDDDENETFETQDYIDPDPSIEDKIIEEQLKIEKMILQEKEDRKLALKLSREWESELMKKPQTRSMQAAATTRTNPKAVVAKKSQQTLMESIASRTRNRKK